MTRSSAREEMFEQLFRRHYAAVVAYARRRVTADAVDDAVSETFTVAWRRLDRVPTDALPWLLGVARNVIATQRRGAMRRESLFRRLKSGSRERDNRDGANPSAEPSEYASSIVDALSRLSEGDREAITLIAWDGLTPAEAAVVLGQSAASFRVRLHRAKRRLRNHLLTREMEERWPPKAEHQIREEGVHE